MCQLETAVREIAWNMAQSDAGPSLTLSYVNFIVHFKRWLRVI